ncbi:MAG: phosphohistidine phosphatase SixA [Gammaproteobacteria bacterium]|nr:MAG: phosphohistidine phosphatase SixA [Gammaproteobacteria bacterium]
MQIFVLRHGQAEPQQTTDEARNLTERGRAEVFSNIARSSVDLRELKEIWSSSLTRAQQTAHIVRDILSAQGSDILIKTTDLIAPESEPSILFESLQKANLPSVLLASHQPFVGKFLDLLCGKPLGTYSMDTSSLALVECEIVAAGCGELRWLRHVHGQ